MTQQVAQPNHRHRNVHDRIACERCQLKDLTEHAIIARMAGGDATQFINNTTYPLSVKKAAILQMEETQ